MRSDPAYIFRPVSSASRKIASWFYPADKSVNLFAQKFLTGSKMQLKPSFIDESTHLCHSSSSLWDASERDEPQKVDAVGRT